MKILVVDQFGQFGGAQRCLLDLVPAFQRRQWQLRFMVGDEGPFPERLRSLGIDVTVLPACPLSSIHKPAPEVLRYLRWYPKASRTINRVAAEFRPDLLYVNSPRLTPPVAFFARRDRIPVLFHAHNRLLQAAAIWLLGAHLRLARARIVACCGYVAGPLRPLVPRDSIDIVYNGVPDFRRPRRLSSPFPTIGVLGRIEPEKGQLEFVRAARIVHRELPESRFVVVGAPLLSKSDAYARQTMEESRDLPVDFPGWKDDISSVLCDLDLLVVPSRSYDATPRVVLEAFSAGIPVVAFSSGGIPELIDDGCTGFLVKAHSPEALAARMLQVLRANKEIVAGVAENARRKWAIEFRIETYQEQVCQIITDIMCRA